ncbi:exo-alpha-sialidase [Nonomuraea sp. NEAU-A123]|uniref:golvesin C-terminal-like domain-containing protein n=1 Tax=Nonomuraea sp. NEAU-A123 TaxID=2839649 RepID=UPI001BE49319|nr:exo-alpha-sialidase [Nonomuraea sp. NEAU-A123]MBT2232345.1 exo-alpha-sialidase [Nonomuraea sp. NEAU-A123]
MPMPISRRTFALGLAAGAATTALPSPAAASPAGAEPFFAESTLWDSAVDPLASYHVHALAVLPDDTILACTEGRHLVCDAGPHDLLIRRSTDKGQTWSPSEAVALSVDGQSWSNPTFVVDRVTSEVFLLYGLCVQLPENTSCSADSSTMYVTSSKDGGATWSERRSLAGLFDHFPYNWAMHGPGPGHGIQLDSGRLILTVSHRTIISGVPTTERHYGASTLYSDDHGSTWQAGGEVPMAAGYPTVGEARLVQREDGTVVMNSRPGSGNDWPRDIAVSVDGGLTWSPPTMDFSPGLFNGVDTSLLRYTGGPRSRDVNRMLFSRPDAPMRWNMTVAVSYDEGYSFRYARSVNPGRGYYSDLARLSDGTIVLLYGCDGDLDGTPRRVAAARFNLEWVTQGRDSLATGPKLTEMTHDLGRTAVRARRSGGTASVVSEATARGGARAAFAPAATGDFIEYPFIVAARSREQELWLRYYRSGDGGLMAVTVDGKTPRNSTLDLTSFRGDGYDVVLLDRMRLRPGLHTIRFTLAGAGRGGGTAISLDQLSLIQASAAPDVREEVTVDNGGLGFDTTGTWPSSRGVFGYYGFNYLTHARGTGANLARWRPALPGDDRYEVLVSYAADPNRATNAPYVVHHAEGTTPVAVNQKVRGVPEARMGEWISLGTFPFRAGLDGYVELSDAADGVVIADAVRFRRQARA